MRKQEILFKLDKAINELRAVWHDQSSEVLAQAFEAIKEVFEDQIPDFAIGDLMPALSGQQRNKSKRSDKPKDWGEFWQYIVQHLGMTDDDARYLFNNWKANGFSRNGQPIKDWKAAARAWKAGKFYPSQKQK